MKESIGNPWLMIVCKNTAIAASVDGMQFYGKTFRETGIAEGLLADRLGGEYSGESSVLALQEQPFKLSTGDHHKSVFVVTYLQDHPQATSEDDLNRLASLMIEFGDEVSSQNSHELFTPDKNIFNFLLKRSVIVKKKMVSCYHFSANKTIMLCCVRKKFLLTARMHILCRLKQGTCQMKILYQQPHMLMVFSIRILLRVILILIFCFQFVPANLISHRKQGNESLLRLIAVDIYSGFPLLLRSV
jgi:hypothetical protein